MGDKITYNMEKLFRHFIFIADKRNISLEHGYHLEMSPVPSALFDEYGQMRESSKPQVMKKLAVLKPDPSNVDATIIDGNE